MLYLAAGAGMIVLSGVLGFLEIAKRNATRRAPRGPPRSGGQLLFKPPPPP